MGRVRKIGKMETLMRFDDERDNVVDLDRMLMHGDLLRKERRDEPAEPEPEDAERAGIRILCSRLTKEELIELVADLTVSEREKREELDALNGIIR
tara:strand:+ start:300 stop:587 length:288 start_codon:yes stop_codon:yes gene_type:complete